MTNVSRKPLSANRQDNLFTELSQIISNLSSSEIKIFLNELLGPEEKIMIAKRLAAIVLLEQKYSIYKVAKVLNMSTSTVGKMNEEREQDRYKNICRWLKKDKNRIGDFLNLLDSILTLGGILPHYGQQHKLVNKLKT